jgi:hypothetical protein
MHSAEKVKHLFWEEEDEQKLSPDYAPHLYIEARIDFNDVRTGFRETMSLSKALDIYPDEEGLLWADDMLRDVDPGRLKPFIPDAARLEALPGFVDADFIARTETQFIRYLLRSYETRIYRNFTLNLYSSPGESAPDFMRRCAELLDGPMRGELDSLREVYNRRLEQIAQKYLGAGDGDSARLEQARIDVQNNNLFFRYSERIAGLFLNADPPQTAADPLRGLKNLQELEERLASLETEACQAILRLKDSYAEKARSIDEYVLHPNLKDIHLVRCCILWMPAQAA